MVDENSEIEAGDPAPSPTAEDLFLALSATIGAATLVNQYTAASLIVAAGERGAIDPERVFQLIEVLANGFDSGDAAAGPTGEMTAMMLRAVEPTYRSLVKVPLGAGRG